VRSSIDAKGIQPFRFCIDKNNPVVSSLAVLFTAVLAVNAELLGLYWDIGRQLDAWQRERAWGSAVLEQMTLDLQASYPDMKGFSRTSLFAMR
jgi:hypothetical protein